MLLNPASPFGLEGYLALLAGMRVPVACPYQPKEAERNLWREHLRALGQEAARGCDMHQALAVLRAA